MLGETIPLPVLNTDHPLRLTPTDVSQFVRLEQCERFLRFRIAERAGQKFMEQYGVIPQQITPLLSLSGSSFEKSIEADLDQRFVSVKYAPAPNRPSNNSEVVAKAQVLPPGQSVLLFQPRLEADLNGWRLRGDVDLIRLECTSGGALHVLIADLKSTVEVKVEHKLQVAFYRLMLERILSESGIVHDPIQMGILFRPPTDPAPQQLEQLAPLKDAARAMLGLEGSLLDVIANSDSYLQSARDLVLGQDSTALRVARTPFEEIPYCLSFKCDGCLYNEFCMKWSAEREDLSLLPFMTGTDKEALRRVGITTVRELATIKEFAPAVEGKTSAELVPALGREAQVKKIATTWPIGPRLDELIHRARSFRRSVRKDGTQALNFIPGKGNSSLPVSNPGLNANLIRIYLDAQHDYLEDRVYMLGALVVACANGTPAQRRALVNITEGPPNTASKERELFQRWTRELLMAVVELAQSDSPRGEKKSAPIHIIFFDHNEQRVMLEALARNFPPILEATPPLYDFLTQIAAFDSPSVSYLDEEMRTFKNYPMTCQSLQSVAQFLKFDWNSPHKFRELFKTRLFDNLGKMEIDGTTEWYTRRSRFSSSVPLEYAYAAWGEIPQPTTGKGDAFADYRGVTQELLIAFEIRRLEAVEHIASTIPGNPNTQKTPFQLPDLINYQDKARDLAHALDEFVTIERLVSLNDWKTTRHAPPERRVLMGDCLLVRYLETDQDPGIAEQNRENAQRLRRREEYAAAFKAANPDKQFRLNKEQSAECKLNLEGLRLRLRIEVTGVDCDLHEVLLLSTLRDGERLVLYPRFAVDERLPRDQQTEFTPTPKQMLYGQRAALSRIIATEKDDSGRVQAAVAELEIQESRGGEWSKPYVFPGIYRPLEDGKLYTLDPCPNDWYSYWCAQVVTGLCEGSPNVLYDRLESPPTPSDASASTGQRAFLAGLDAFHEAGLLHNFEPSKREFIGKYAQAPVLLVQGPPGTGKSYSTGFAIFARLQGAIREKRPFRVFVCCKTHAATDVLLRNVLEVREKLRELREANPHLFSRYFDSHLLEVPLYRVAPHDPPPVEVVHLIKDDEKEANEEFNADAIQEFEWAIIAATPGGIYGMLKKRWPKSIFGHELCDLLVLDEASQMNLPEAIMAALPLKAETPIIVVGDHRQMPPIVKHDWDSEARRTFQQFQVYQSLFDTLRAQEPPMIQFAESFRLHAAMAEFLRREIYQHDGIAYHSKKHDRLEAHGMDDDLTKAVLSPEYPLVVIIHDEAECQMRNPFEEALIEPILRSLADKTKHGLDPIDGLGIVVPHRAQRAALQQSFPELCIIDATTGLPSRSAIDTVERFQGGERNVILVSATESDRAYLLASSRFLLDPRRLTVAISRAKQKMILVASRSIFSLFSPDEEIFANALLWKNLLQQSCTTLLWTGERNGKRVEVWGGNSELH